jgi:N-methylhydantoinase B
VISICSAGGGYGAPDEREPERVRADVRDGFVTRRRAQDVYRVALTDSDEVDVAATAALRGGDESGG